MRNLIDELLTASAFPHPVTHLIRHETHISWVILTGHFAYKIKKPVRLDFIDCTALSTRQRMCEQEVTLNRRLATDLYLGVVAITRKSGVVSVVSHRPEAPVRDSCQITRDMGGRTSAPR